MEKIISSYAQTLHLFACWLMNELKIYAVDKISENTIHKYIDNLMVHGKYTFYVNNLPRKRTTISGTLLSFRLYSRIAASKFFLNSPKIL